MAKWGNLTGLLNTTVNFLLVLLVITLFVKLFGQWPVSLYVNLDYFLAIIAAFGFCSILLQAVRRHTP